MEYIPSTNTHAKPSYELNSQRASIAQFWEFSSFSRWFRTQRNVHVCVYRGAPCVHVCVEDRARERESASERRNNVMMGFVVDFTDNLVWILIWMPWLSTDGAQIERKMWKKWAKDYCVSSKHSSNQELSGERGWTRLFFWSSDCNCFSFQVEFDQRIYLHLVILTVCINAHHIQYEE